MEELKEFQDMIHDMDLPIWRKTQNTPMNLKWLARNMGIRNSEHPRFKDAKTLLVKLLRQ